MPVAPKTPLTRVVAFLARRLEEQSSVINDLRVKLSQAPQTLASELSWADRHLEAVAAHAVYHGVHAALVHPENPFSLEDCKGFITQKISHGARNLECSSGLMGNLMTRLELKAWADVSELFNHLEA